MEKILVTTDQSVQSKSALRLAIGLAKARKAELIVLQVYHLLKPFKWTDHTFKEYRERYCEKNMAELTGFISAIFQSLGETELSYRAVLYDHIDVADGIREYTKKHQCSLICISTRGAGRIKKLFGTHTSALIGHSEIPVLAVPAFRHLKRLTKIMYATDMTDSLYELNKVVDFARPLKASVELLHLAYPADFMPDRQGIADDLSKEVNYPVCIIEKKRNIVDTLLEDIDRDVRLRKPSVIVFFHHQFRPLLERWLYPTNATDYSFNSKVPLLIFPKRPAKN